MPFVVKTELGAGTEDARGMKKLEPADVADAIVDAIKRGVVDVWVPRSARHTHRLSALLPRRASEGVARALKADRVLMGADKQARAAYELRAAHSEPGLEPGEEPRQLTS
jgi:glutamate mutase epsilon subunit